MMSLVVFYLKDIDMRNAFNQPRNIISLEMIDYQDDKFGIKLEAILTDLHTKMKDSTYKANKDVRDSIEVELLKKAIFDRLGIKVKVITNSILAAVLPFYPTTHHIFLHDFWRGNVDIPDQEKLLRESNNKVGFVDLKKVKLGGVFSEYENTLYMNFSQLFFQFNLSVQETVAVMFHELGHIFEVCEYSDRLNTNNQILAQIAKDLSKNKKEKNISYIFKNLKHINEEVTEADVEKIINGTKIVAGYTWFKVVMGSVSQQLRESKYDETSFEQLADNFATRFQYGRPLVTGLDKIMIEYFSPERVRAARIFSMIMNAFGSLYLTVGIIGTAFAGMFPLTLLLIFFFWLILLASGEKNKDYTYDELRVRYARIRNEYVGMIKNMNLADDETKIQVKEILDNIHTIDGIMEDVEQYKSIFNILGNLFFKSNRDALSSIKEQQLLESLAFNDLFVKSAQLQHQG